jgi:hypothetical protein
MRTKGFGLSCVTLVKFAWAAYNAYKGLRFGCETGVVRAGKSPPGDRRVIQRVGALRGVCIGMHVYLGLD